MPILLPPLPVARLGTRTAEGSGTCGVVRLLMVVPHERAQPRPQHALVGLVGSVEKQLARVVVVAD